MRKALFDKTKYTKWYITEDGRILTKSTFHSNNCLKEVKPNINKKRGYFYARTSNKNYQIHRLVATAFITNLLNKSEVNHKDGDKHNNNITNLEWVTRLENIRHSIDNGFTKQMDKNQGNLKYTTEQCLEVYNRSKSGMSHIEAGSIYDMPYSTVAHLIRGSRRRI